MLQRRINPTEIQLHVVNPHDFTLSHRDSHIAVFLGATGELLFMCLPGISLHAGFRLTPRMSGRGSIGEPIVFQIKEIDESEYRETLN